MKKVLLILILPLISLAQFNFIPISADYSSFASTDSSSFVQIYTAFYQGNLEYNMNDDSLFIASFSSTISISQNDSLIQNIQHNYQNSSEDTTRLMKFNQFVDVFSIDIPLGTYNVSIVVKDNNSGLKGESNFNLQTITPKRNIYFSDVELCTKIKNDTAQSLFNKNGLQVIPNPSGIYDALNPLFYYYIELNNLSYSTEKVNQYNFQYFFTNSTGDTLRKKPVVTKKIIAPRQVELGGMNVIALPAGNYVFHAIASDLASGSESRIDKNFRVYKPTKKKVKETGTAEEIAEYYIGMTEEQLEEEFKQAIYIRTKQEKKVFESLGEVASMQRFLTQFWNRRDTEQGIPLGSFRRLYLKRVDIANEKYSSMGIKGWKTDMGRVFIIYGEPDEYERNPNSIDMLPHVIWYYHNLEGGAQFVFADEEGFGQYRQIHSTYRKELQNQDWRNIISKNTGTNQY